MVNENKINIIIDNFVKGEDKLKKLATTYQLMGENISTVSKSMEQKALRQEQALDALAKKNRFLSNWSKKLGVNTARVRDAMGSAGLTFDETGKVVDLAGRKVKDLNKVMKLGELNTRRFNMSMLSVMFAGMALQRTMGGLLRPAAEATGIFDIFGDILEDTFAPIMESIAPIFEFLSDILDKVGDSTKLVVGAIVLFLFAGGIALGLVGQLSLAYAGLSLMLGKLTISLVSASAGMHTLGISSAVAGTTAQVAFAPFLPIMYAILAVIGLLALIFYKWEFIVDSLGDTFKKFGATTRLVVTSVALFFGWLSDRIYGFWDSIIDIFTGIGDFISETWDKITTWLSDTWDNIKQYFIDKWDGMINWFKEKWQGLKDWFWGILVSIGSFFKNVWNSISTWFWNLLVSIGTFFKNTWNSISTWFSTTLSNIGIWFKEKWTGIKTWFSEHLNSVFQFFKDIWNGIHDWLSEKLNIISTFFSNIWIGIKNTASDIWNGIKNTIKNAINGIIGFINMLIRAWNSLSFSVPSVRVGKYTFGGWEIGVPQIPNIPLLAEGGIFNKPSLAMIGERGPEAVVPLGRGYGETVINFSPTYNINVSDKADFERMIKFNNTKLVEDLRRLIDN